MAKKTKALIGFGEMSDDQLLTIATTILAAMTGNAYFPNPTPDLADIQLLLDDYSVKLAAARKRGSPEDTALKDDSADLLIAGLQKLAYHVNSVAEGKLAIVLSSGFLTNAQDTPTQTPNIVLNIQLSDTNQSGQMRLDFDSQKRVRLYEYCFRKVSTPEEPWSERFITTSSRNNVIAPLEVGQYYEVRVRAVNGKGAGDWSNTARLLVR